MSQQQSQSQEFTLGQKAQAEPTSTVAMAQEIGSGKMPHNDTIVSSLKEFEEPLGQQAKGKTGPEARIAQHTQNLVQHTREMFQDKNKDNALQNIHSHSLEASKALAEGAKEGHSQTIGQEQGNWTDERVLELRNLLQAFRKLATTLARNNSFRTDLIEAIQLFQTLIFDITHSAIDKRLTKAKTSGQSEIESAASSDTSSITGSSTTSQGTVDTTPITPIDNAPTTSWKGSDVQPSTFSVPLTNVGSKGFSESSGENVAKSTIQPLEQSSESSSESGSRSASGSAQMSDEEKQHAFEKMERIMCHLGRTNEYKELIEQLSNFFQHNGQQIMTIAGTGSSNSQSALRALGDDIQLVLERFSGDVSLTPMREHVNTIIVSAKNDSEVKSFFDEWRNVLIETIQTPDQKDPKELDSKFQQLARDGNNLLKKPEYRENWQFVLGELRSFLERVKDDTHIQNIGSDVENLRREIMLNENGQLDFGQVRRSLPALKNVLIPALTAALKTIPVPPIKSDDEKYSLEVSNLSLAAEDLVPDNLRLHFANDLYFDFSGSGNDRFDSALSLNMNDFHATLRDLQFKYERKKMPKMTDEGVADIEIQGMTMKFRWLMEKNNDKLTFTCDKVRCQIRTLNTNIKQAQHKMLDKIALKLFNTQIKRGIEQSTENALKERLGKFEIDTSSGVPLKEQLKMSSGPKTNSFAGVPVPPPTNPTQSG